MLIGKPQVVTTPEEAMDIRTIGGAASAYANLPPIVESANFRDRTDCRGPRQSVHLLYMSEDRGSEFFLEVEANSPTSLSLSR